MQQHLHILASAIGDNCSAALVFDDEAAAAEILSALSFDKSVTRAVLTDPRSAVVARYPASEGTGLVVDGSLRVDRAISVDGRTVGYLTIWAETDNIAAHTAMEGVVGITAFVVGILVVLLLYERMQRVLNAPLVELHDTIRRVVRSRNYAIRAERSAEDELNDVVMAVNDLLAQVEEQTAAARASNSAEPAAHNSTAAPAGAPETLPSRR
jgi:methyl-accepting chemotaxis protein